MDLSIVIPCHGGVEDTRACIHTLLHEQAPALDATEILVVDNASPDATAQLDQIDPRVRVLRSETNLGFAGGVNLGLAAARGREILVLNNDTLAAPSMVAELRRALARDANIGAVAPTSNHVKGEARVAVGSTIGTTRDGRAEIERTLRGDLSGSSAPAASRSEQDVETLSGLCLLVRRAVIDLFGGFDPRFGAGMFEDDDFSLRLRLAGRRLVIARHAFLHHHGHRTFHRLGHSVQPTLEAKQALFIEKWRSHPTGAIVCARLRGEPLDRASILRALEATPEWPDGHSLLAQIDWNASDPARATQAAIQFLERCPSHGPTQALLGAAQVSLGEVEAGSQTLQDALQTQFFDERDIATALHRFGLALYGREENAQALRCLEDALSYAPEDAALRAALGATYVKVGRFEEAESHLEAATRNGAAADAWNNLAICAYSRGDTAAAIEHFRTAVAAAPHEASYRENLQHAQASTNAKAVR